MSTSKHFDVIAVITVLIALVISIAMALTWQNVEKSSVMSVSKNDIANVTEYINLDDWAGDVSIVKGGTYYFTGTLSDGRIAVDTDDSESVILVLAGTEINCSNDSAIYVANSGNCAVYLEEGTENTVTSGTERKADRKEIDADAEGGAVLLKDNATICGEGSLTVYGYINNGIHCSNDLYIESGTITVTAVNNGIKGKDSLTIDGGSLSISAGNAGLKSGKSGDSDSGSITVNGGDIYIIESYEGMEANQITINDGQTRINASDDGINACGGSNSMGIGMGNQTGMDPGKSKQIGMSSPANEEKPGEMSSHADEEKPGEMNSPANEEKPDDMSGPANEEKPGEMSGQNMNHEENQPLQNADSGQPPEMKDGHGGKGGGQAKKPETDNSSESPEIPEAGSASEPPEMPGAGSASEPPEMPGAGSLSDKPGMLGRESTDDTGTGDETAMPSLTVNGGFLYVLAGGDGLDSNGDMIINGGTVIVDGPSDNGNGALDSGSENGGNLLVNGGTLIAVGGAGMAEEPEDESEQNYISCKEKFSSGDRIAIRDSEGNIIFEYNAAKSGDSVIFSSPELEAGSGYSVSIADKEFQLTVK